MIWFFERGTQAVRLETRYDKGAQEYTVLITWADTSTNMERYASFDAYHARILSLEQLLEVEQWRLAGAPTLIASDWPGP